VLIFKCLLLTLVKNLKTILSIVKFCLLPTGCLGTLNLIAEYISSPPLLKALVCLDAETKSFKKVYTFNEKLVHLVDDSFFRGL
jgi:hypothetical protein